MKIPTTLKHKPVIVSENYENIDGRNAYCSDTKGLSLGLAQWNDRGKVDISENPQIDRVGLQGDAMTVAVCRDNPMLDEDIKLFASTLSADDEMLGERFRTLSRILKEMGY